MSKNSAKKSFNSLRISVTTTAGWAIPKFQNTTHMSTDGETANVDRFDKNDGAIFERADEVGAVYAPTSQDVFPFQFRSSKFPALLFILCSFLLTPVMCQIKVLTPSSLSDSVKSSLDYGSDVLVGSTATFGAPAYGESFVGHVVYVAPDKSNYCDKTYKSNITNVLNKLPSSDSLRHIFFLHRGACTFVKKVAIAESLGADAVLVMDSEDSSWTREELLHVIMADDGHGGKVKIPSILINKDDGKMFIKTLLSGEDVVVQLVWSIPQKSVVMADFWTEAGSSVGQRFLKEYAYHASLLKQNLRFTPHYNIYTLSSVPSKKKDNSSVSTVSPPPPSSQSNSLCWPSSTEFCSDPPDFVNGSQSGSSKATGRDVLGESLRQMCIFELTAVPTDGVDGSLYSSEWWEYVRKFPDECPVGGRDSQGVLLSGSLDNMFGKGRVLEESNEEKDSKELELLGLMETSSANTFGEECSYRVMKQIPGIQIEKVQKCVQNDWERLFNREKENKAWSVLALRINGMRFSGNLDPLLVSKAVCSAFQTAPEVCAKLTGRIPEASKQAGISLHSLLTLVFLVISTFLIALYLYQQHIKKSMRNSLRHEVMLEVKSQLQDYQRMDDNYPRSPPNISGQCEMNDRTVGARGLISGNSGSDDGHSRRLIGGRSGSVAMVNLTGAGQLVG